MAKIKFTKGELKRQRDALKQFQRYLPTLQLKKQQLQLEILQKNNEFLEKQQVLDKKIQAAMLWAGLLADPEVNLKDFLKIKRVIVHFKNIAGSDIPIFDSVEFVQAEYDLFNAPLWVDLGIEYFKEIISLKETMLTIEKSIEILQKELHVTAQRVNLFEKVKIPAAEENIRLIKIYIGDQMANAVGRSKIAKRKLELLEEARA